MNDNFRQIKGKKNEEGVALITVIILTAVLMVMGAGMYVVASREQTMTSADYAGGQAFYYAEGGLENVLGILNDTNTESQLTQQRADQSANDYGYLMDPTPANRQNPSDPVEMQIGQDKYTVYVDTVDQNGVPCTECSSSNISYLLITAEGQSATGYRKLQQMVKVSKTVAGSGGYPLSLYSAGNADFNGTPDITNQILYVKGNVSGRSKLSVSGTDAATGKPAGVYATGDIDNRQTNDRDKNGPSGNKFLLADLEAAVNISGLSSAQLQTLKSEAIQQGNYYTSSSIGTVHGDSNGNAVLFIDFPSFGSVGPKFTWPAPGYVTIVVKNGDITLTGGAIGSSRAIIYCPDGTVTAHGGGSGGFTGLIWAGKGLTSIGNFEFNMDPTFMNGGTPPSFLTSTTITRMASWKEVDR